MKKLLLATVLTCLFMSTNAFADGWITGTVHFIQVTPEGDTVVAIHDGVDLYTYPVIAATTDATKTVIAISLTAKSTGGEVNGYEESGAWISILY